MLSMYRVLVSSHVFSSVVIEPELPLEQLQECEPRFITLSSRQSEAWRILHV